MNWINKAIEHTPTVVELYLVKAKIFQYAGNRVQAYNLTEEARCLDKADRYLNAHSSKFLLKAGETQRAWETMGMFSRTDDNGDPNIHEMQTLWYEVHAGLGHLSKNELRQSLKNFNFIEKHIDTMTEDCYDFNFYAFKKGSVNHYL